MKKREIFILIMIIAIISAVVIFVITNLDNEDYSATLALKEGKEENPYKEEYDDFLKEENCKTITISGDFGCGKSLFSVFLSKVISRQNKKVLLIDFDLENMSINTLFGVKKYKEKQTYIEDCITKVNENLDIVCGMD